MEREDVATGQTRLWAGHNNSPCQKSTIHHFIVNINGIHLQVQGKKDGEPDDKENQTQGGRGEGALLSDGECQVPPAGSSWQI